jgi:hypothetical protein
MYAKHSNWSLKITNPKLHEEVKRWDKILRKSLKDSGQTDTEYQAAPRAIPIDQDLINAVAMLSADWTHRDFLVSWAAANGNCAEACRQFNFAKDKGRKIITTFRKWQDRYK